ncbi:MAG: class I SAM-dependent methyltransferase [Pseudomonadota bacterium]
MSRHSPESHRHAGPSCSALIILSHLLCCTVIGVAQANSTQNPEHYRYAAPSRDGIGKIYMGREISHVMGHLGAGWLERPERVQEERTDLLLNLLPLERGDTVADIGAGTGYFTLPMAARVGPEGWVLGVDIQPEMLAILAQRQRSLGVNNVRPVLATESDPSLPQGEVDLVLMVDAYHEFSHPREVMDHVVESLAPNGKVALVEYRGEDPTVPIKPLHKMTVAQAEREMAAVGLQLHTVHHDLPWQHVMIFRRAVVPGANAESGSAAEQHGD